ncbi:MAG: S41 family peptidase [Candidatus Moduliflexus flocculans]|nr:S41 family peptidase [Candidatus Moduliflexus flocculans]
MFRSDPEYQDNLSPLGKPMSAIREGEIISGINGVPTLSVPDPSLLLRNTAGQQVLLEIKPAAGGAACKEIVVPITPGAEADLRYSEWEYTRRLEVEKASKNEIGYVHLRAMGGDNYTEWVKNFYPVFDRKGLIIDVRHNRGGNIDSWILEKLLRQGLVLLAGPGRQADLEHAARLPRPPGRPVQRAHRLGRRGVRRGLPAPRPGQGHRHADLGRRDLAELVQRPRRPRPGLGGRNGRLRARGRLAHRGARRRSGHRRRQPAPRDIHREGRPARGGRQAPPGAHRQGPGRRAQAPALSRQKEINGGR